MKPIWAPSPERIRASNVMALARFAGTRHSIELPSYDALYEFSVARGGDFWSCLWDYLQIVGTKGTDVLSGDTSSVQHARWFPEAELNFAENLLRRSGDDEAVVCLTETGMRRTLSWRELNTLVRQCMRSLRSMDVRPGDRVAGYLPNGPDALIAMLATTGLGAIWCACAPDYGVPACLDRLQQIQPSVLFSADGYSHRGRWHDLTEKTQALVDGLPGLRHTVQGPFAPNAGFRGRRMGVDFAELCRGDAGQVEFKRFPFAHPAFILFSSGTTGKPKCIVHGAGGTLLQTAKELALQCDVKAGDKVFYMTNAAWMVWNVMVAGLALEAPIILYEGSPAHPGPTALLDIIDAEAATAVRIVPRLLDEYARAGLRPRETHSLKSLRCLMAGSEPLLPHHYRYVYEHIKTDVHLMSPAGGTDVMATLASGNPAGPVYPGEIQARSLGMKVEVLDQHGTPHVGVAGELVCTRPFPSVPLAFWGDGDGAAMQNAYFTTYPGIWRHGDWAQVTPRGGVVIYGRSDATLNVNGVRIGTSEIYRTLQDVPYILGCAAVERRGAQGSQIVLFLELGDSCQLTPEMEEDLKATIRSGASARHVPACIYQVDALPRSSNGKVSEAAVRDAVNGMTVKNAAGLLNAQVLEALRPFAASN